jgi:hypothetical protein
VPTPFVRASVAAWAVATVVVGTAITGCSHKPPSPWVPGPGAYPGATSTSSTSAPSSTSSSAAPGPSSGQPTDYSSLLIQAGDIGEDFTAPQPPVLNPNNTQGVAQLFANSDNSRRIGDTILIVANPAVAALGASNTRANYEGKVSGTWQSIDVGSNGAILSGTSPDNAQAVTVLLFTEGRALVNLEFDSAPDDPIDTQVATEIGLKQLDAIKAGLHD